MSLNKAPLYQRIYGLVAQIPSGKVANYGQIADFTGGCTARMVGYAMAAIPPEVDIPWQRVVNSQGKVSPRRSGDGSLIQKQLLEAEGIPFSAKDKIDMKVYRWQGPDPEWAMLHDFFID